MARFRTILQLEYHDKYSCQIPEVKDNHGGKLIYLAARYSRLEELQGYATDLRALGHRVEARWLLGDHQIHEGADLVEALDTITIPIQGRPFAQDDYDDVFDADMLIAFSEPPRAAGASRGGRHVEFGLALAWCKEVVVVGPRENVFHTLEGVQHFWTWQLALDVLFRGREKR